MFLLDLERISLNNAVKYFCADCVWPGMNLGSRGPIPRVPVDVKQALDGRETGVRQAPAASLPGELLRPSFRF